MRQAIADFAAPTAEWHLIVQCAGHCRRQRRLVADLVLQLPPGLTWAEVLPKLRCNQCGEPADIVGLSGLRETPGVGGTWLLLQRGAGQWRI